MAEYGNVPEEDVHAVQSSVRMALKVAAQVFPVAPPEWKPIAYELILDGILSDWVANGTNELDENDEADLSNLLRLSVDTAMVQEGALREVTFRTVLRNAMKDWVENWNGDEDDDEEDF